MGESRRQAKGFNTEGTEKTEERTSPPEFLCALGVLSVEFLAFCPLAI
jgi:hypothetical protein